MLECQMGNEIEEFEISGDSAYIISPPYNIR